MKRIALLVLTVAANVIANEEENIQQVATNFETDVSTVKICLTEAGTTAEQMQITKQKWQEIKDDEDIDEETKESFTTHGRFVACILEKNDMMKDSKLVLDKILEAVEKEPNDPTVTKNKQVVTECVTSLNEADQLNREDRAFGLMLCINRKQQTTER
ncbi:uncharacterized protein LOC115233696 [Formica exsecta]|uniref:uncharacterized protein LOC115233696 n=1 Tax=Formica exsecta TaxID=72781 RepID=UPI0011439385|nr:uncharacterized protein LOC115233696 [Formica exsecta]